MKYFLIVLVGFIVVQATRYYIRLSNLKERLLYELDKVESEISEDPESPILYGKRGTLYQNMQNFDKANLDFKKALEMTRVNPEIDRRDELLGKLQTNIRYTEKPLPWSKRGPKDLSKSWLTYWLIQGFGGKRFNIKG